MQNQDEIILKKIQELFNNNSLTGKNFKDLLYQLTALYSDLSFERSYTLRELFPRIPDDYKIGKDAISKAEENSRFAQQKWDEGGSPGGYVSLRELHRNRTGIDVGREYAYPNNMSPREFQESFTTTMLCKQISYAYTDMAQYGLMMLNKDIPDMFYDTAVGWKLFVEKAKPVATRLIKEAYCKFWKANSKISGYEELKNIQNFDEMREFLMGVASEIPLDDVRAYLNSEYHDDKKATNEIHKNTLRYREEFHEEITFGMTDKTWKKCVQPVLDKRKASEKIKKKKSSGLKSTIEGLKGAPSTKGRSR